MKEFSWRNTNNFKDFFMFLKIFKKIIILMIIEDLTFYLLGKLGISLLIVLPIIVVIACLFTMWIINTREK